MLRSSGNKGFDVLYLSKIIGVFWIFYKLTSINLWFDWGREFPRLPVFDLLSRDVVPAAVHDGLSLLSVLLIFFVSFSGPRRSLYLAVLIVEIALCLFDQMRWQPLEFQFLLLYAGLYFARGDFKVVLRLLMAATYLYGGLNKFNLGFINYMWASGICQKFLGLDVDFCNQIPIKAIGFAVPAFEVILGIALLTKHYKKALAGIVLLHIGILIYIGPLGRNINNVVWSWNVLMILFAVHLYRSEFFAFSGRLFRSPFNVVFIAVIFLLPSLHFLRMYNPYFAFNLYAGNDPVMVVYTDNASFQKYEREGYVDYYQTRLPHNIYIYDRAVDELNTPVPPHPHFFYELKTALENGELSGSDSEFYIVEYPYKEEDARLMED